MLNGEWNDDEFKMIIQQH